MFDPQAIEAFRRHVEMRITTVTLTYTFVGLVLGLLALSAFLGREAPLNWWATIGFSTLGGCLGYIVGCERAFMLRLQAQMTLFQAHIEANTEQRTDTFEALPTRVNPPCQSLLVKAGLRIN